MARPRRNKHESRHNKDAINKIRVGCAIDLDTYESMLQASRNAHDTQTEWLRKTIYSACWDVVPDSDIVEQVNKIRKERGIDEKGSDSN